MFREIVLASALLVGCGTKASSEPRIVEVFQETSTIKPTSFNQNDCRWKTVELSIFNQKDQNIKFDYLGCPEDENLRFMVKNGNEIFSESGEDSKHIFTVWKTAPLTDKEFIVSLISEKSRDKCMAIHGDNNHWKIGLNDFGREPGDGWVMYPPLSDIDPKYSDINGICGPYGFNLGNDWAIGIKEGIGIAYSELMALLAFYDLNSITYESRG